MCGQARVVAQQHSDEGIGSCGAHQQRLVHSVQVLSAPVADNRTLMSAACRNGGHERLCGLQDHHLLHYKVTVACAIHVANIMSHTYVQ